MVFTVGPKPFAVTELGRWVIVGNRNAHVLKLINAQTKADVSGGAVTLSLEDRRPERFHYAVLPEPVTLEPGGTY
jgi:hypothetical protein